MKNAVITEIKQRMTPYLNDFQIDQLTDVLEICLQEYLAEADPVKQPDIRKHWKPLTVWSACPCMAQRPPSTSATPLRRFFMRLKQGADSYENKTCR